LPVRRLVRRPSPIALIYCSFAMAVVVESPARADLHLHRGSGFHGRLGLDVVTDSWTVNTGQYDTVHAQRRFECVQTTRVPEPPGVPHHDPLSER
jgi:hypothetical protein